MVISLTQLILIRVCVPLTFTEHQDKIRSHLAPLSQLLYVALTLIVLRVIVGEKKLQMVLKGQRGISPFA